MDIRNNSIASLVNNSGLYSLGILGLKKDCIKYDSNSYLPFNLDRRETTLG